MSGLEQRFHDAADCALQHVRGDEVLLANFYAERTDFVRFSQSRLRQPGFVEDCDVSLDLVRGAKRVRRALRLTGSKEIDQDRIAKAVAAAREALESSPEDPQLLINRNVQSTRRVKAGSLPSRTEAVDALAEAGRGRDMVGIYAAGDQGHGFANSLGQRNWDESQSFNLDWCFYHAGDKAAKANYAGFVWDHDRLRAKTGRALDAVAALARPPITIPPGDYRAYLTPAALAELWAWLSWDSFGLAAHKTQSTGLLALLEGRARLSALVTLSEDTAGGAAPGFQEDGFVKPAQVPLLAGGQLQSALVSPRSAAEYGVATNGANGAEAPQSLCMEPGALAEGSLLRALGTGVFVSNLWYLNYSDRNEGRMTGMTRFACLWVEKGEIVAPLNVMRFDDSLYRMLGSQLEALSADRAFLLDPGSYERRSCDSMRLPGALLSELRFTL
jgi:predicted Zn-dependent protease